MRLNTIGKSVKQPLHAGLKAARSPGQPDRQSARVLGQLLEWVARRERIAGIDA